MSGNAATVQMTFPKEGFYLYHEGQNLGPFTMEQVLQKFDSGVVVRTTPMWFPGLANWITIADLPDLDRRGPVAKEIAIPEKDRPDSIIVQLKNHPIPLRPQSVKALVTNEDLRRTDMVYDENAKNWIRADQHFAVRAYFSMPGAPSPLPATGTTSVEGKTSDAKTALKTNAKAPAKATDANSKKVKIVWILVAVVGAALLAALVWTFFPLFKNVQSSFKSPATVQPASFLALPVEEFGIRDHNGNKVLDEQEARH